MGGYELIDTRRFLSRMFHTAVSAADPAIVLAQHLPQRPKGRTVVVGAGKGAAQMAAVLETLWEGPLEGVVVTRYGYAAPTTRIRIIEAAHPVPDQAGLTAARALMKAVSGLSPDDLVVALVCGGGSALLPAPAPGLSLEDEIAVNRLLLESGMPIQAMNAIRKHVSQIKGGRLAAAASPARVVTLVVSDIPGDDAALVASGPTVAGPQTRQDALCLIETYRLQLPPRVMAHLNSTLADAPRPDDMAFAGNDVHLVASAATSLEAAAEAARQEGITPVILSDAVQGEASNVGSVHAAIAREVAIRQRPFAKPALILSGGETTVTVRAKGKGGRNTEFLLGFAIGIDGTEGIDAIAADTDGIDGSEDNAGAFADTGTVRRMLEAGIDPRRALAGNDCWTAFSGVGDLFVCGPTGTNVNDFRAILVR